VRPGHAVALVLAGLLAGCGSVHDAPVDAGMKPTGDGGGGGSATTQVAPYYYAYGWGSPSYAFSTLVAMRSMGGPSAVSIGFVLSNGGCAVTPDIHDNLADVHAYVAAGGHVKASFGGSQGTYLEYSCASADALASALEAFVDDTGITDLDFDLEQHAMSSNAQLNALRATALERVQAERGVQVSFTLPVGPDGLLQESIDILAATLQAGVSISIVNALAMDYGDGTDLSTVPMQSTDALAVQLHGLMSTLTLEQVYRHVGVTAMIGKNDDDETLSVDDARGLVSYVQSKHLGLVSFWAIQRDQVCASAGTSVGICSQLDQHTFDFNAIFQAAAP
jgi:chitinase